MRDDLLYHYEQELAFLRRAGAQFAERYPKIASRLLLEPTRCADPHVERLLEGFAFLAARIHLKLEDDFSEISEGLLSVAYPHFLRPIPSVSIAELGLDPDQGKLTTGFAVPRHSEVLSRPVGGAPCRFRTCYDTTLWPITVKGAQWRTPDQLQPPITGVSAVGAVRLELHGLPDVTFAKLDLNTLRFYLNGGSSLVATLYEVLCNNCVQVLLRDLGSPPHRPIVLPGTALRPVGFAEDEGLLPLPRRTMVSYRLLQEYFAFPEKFFFLDLDGFAQARAAGFGARVEVVFLITPFERPERRAVLETGVSDRTFRTGCTPIINLFTQDAEPVQITGRRHEYLLVADARRRETTRIFSVDEVVAAEPGATQVVRMEPMYSGHSEPDGARPTVFWRAASRLIGGTSDGTTETYLSFVDRSGQPARPRAEAVTARVTCHNGDLPSRLPFSDEGGDLVLPGGGPVQKVIALIKPTAAIPPPLGSPLLWRLISQLSLNYTSLAEGGTEGLQELLRLHNVGDSVAGAKQIQGIIDVRSAPCYARIDSDRGLSFARGHRVELTLDEEQFTGGSAYLFASVLDRFLGLYTSLNSFCILAARTKQRKETMREWPPRAGWKTLV